MINYLKIFHLFSLFGLIALIGIAGAASLAVNLRQYKRLVLMWAGIASVAVFLSGFALLGIQHYGMPAWAILKFACWLFVSALGGLMFAKPEKIKSFSVCGGVAIVVALAMVFFKPVL